MWGLWGKEERTALTLEKVKGIWAFIPRMPGQQQEQRPPLVCLSGSILANRIQDHPWSPLPPPTHWCTTTNERGHRPGALWLQCLEHPPDIWGNTISLFCWRKVRHHIQSHKWAGILDDSSPWLHTGNKMRLHHPSLHRWFSPSQNSLGAQTFQDNSLGGKNFITLFYSILTAFGKG